MVRDIIFGLRTYIWTDYRQKMIGFCLMVAVGTCFPIGNYAVMVGELRDKRYGYYLGGF